MSSRKYLLLLSLFLCASLPDRSVMAAPPLELYVNPDMSFALYKPIGWSVSTQDHPNGRTIMVADPNTGSTAVMTIVSTTDTANDSIGFAARTVQNIRASVPNLELSWAKSTNDKRRSVVETHYRDAQGREKRFRSYFIMDYPTAKSFGYETAADDFMQLQPIMLSILGNLTFLDQKALQSEASAQSAQRKKAVHPMSDMQMGLKGLPDGSGSMLLPAGWTLQGGAGSAIALSSDKAAGFSFSTAQFWGPSNVPYFNSASVPGVLHYGYMKPIDAVAVVIQQFGSSSIQVLQRWKNPQREQEAALLTRRPSESETAFLRYVTSAGVPTRGYYDAAASAPLPSGQWMVLFWGVWAPDASFDQYAPSLARMAASYRINEQFASNYIQQGLAKLREQMARTQAAMTDAANTARESNLSVFEEHMRSGDYIDYKRSSVIRGEQEWVSEVEGGALYKSDHWGLSREGQQLIEGENFNYNNFRGENPRYNENMTPVDASREVFERVFGRAGLGQ